MAKDFAAVASQHWTTRKAAVGSRYSRHHRPSRCSRPAASSCRTVARRQPQDSGVRPARRRCAPPDAPARTRAPSATDSRIARSAPFLAWCLACAAAASQSASQQRCARRSRHSAVDRAACLANSKYSSKAACRFATISGVRACAALHSARSIVLQPSRRTRLASGHSARPAIARTQPWLRHRDQHAHRAGNP